MKDRLLWVISFALFVDIGLHVLNLYERRGSTQPSIQVPSDAVIKLDGYPVQGDTKTTVILMEFSDYECPYCIRHASSVATDLKERFVKTGKIRYAFLNSPLPIHPNARFLATAGICAGQQDRFWQMHDFIFRHQPKTRSDIEAEATVLGINWDQYQQCLEDSATGRQIDMEMRQARELGFTGTPGFVLGTVDSAGEVSAKLLITGARPLDVFERAITDLLKTTAANGN